MQALLIIDLQQDFCPGGSLAIDGGDLVVPGINALAAEFRDKGLPVIATKDWHPANHVSFASAHPGHAILDVVEVAHGLTQVLWPDHCVQGTEGADFHPDLDTSLITDIVLKGCDPDVDSYSAFFDNARLHTTTLHDTLSSYGVTDLTICGLAIDYCVKFSALDARELGYTVTLPLETTRAIDAEPGESGRALAAMQAAGVTVTGALL